MDKFLVQGSGPLNGEVRIGGAKNSALKLMAASLLAEGSTSLLNVPDITDVAIMIESPKAPAPHVSVHLSWQRLQRGRGFRIRIPHRSHRGLPRRRFHRAVQVRARLQQRLVGGHDRRPSAAMLRNIRPSCARAPKRLTPG